MDKNNQGAFFVNDKRDKDTQPHYKGNATVEGQDFYISIWANNSKEGKKYWSIKFEPKAKAEQAAEKPKAAPVDDDSGDLPF